MWVGRVWEYVQKREGIGVHGYLCICEGEEGVIVCGMWG